MKVTFPIFKFGKYQTVLQYLYYFYLRPFFLEKKDYFYKKKMKNVFIKNGSVKI